MDETSEQVYWMTTVAGCIACGFKGKQVTRDMLYKHCNLFIIIHRDVYRSIKYMNLKKLNLSFPNGYNNICTQEIVF